MQVRRLSARLCLDVIESRRTSGHRIPLAKVFYSKMRCNVLLLSYRGYGLSEGSPSEKGASCSSGIIRLALTEFRNPGLRIDAQTALDHITNHESLSRSPVVCRLSYGGRAPVKF